MLEVIAELMRVKSAESHSKGMSWMSQSGRISQFAVIGTDEETDIFLDYLIKDGLVDMVDGVPVVVEFGEPEARIDIRITSGGGDS